MSTTTKKYDLDLIDITPRGYCYFQSWKGDTKNSGGIVIKISVLFYCKLYLVFGYL